MNQSTSAPRIDEILRRQGLISEEQIKAALQYQREHGGRLGSHLVRLGFVTEAQLLAALSEQFGCESVALSQVSISLEVTRMLPVNVVLARTVMPFGFDQATNTLGVACEDPTDNTLLEELRFVAKGKNIRLHVAAEMSLRSAIAEHYVAVAEAPLAEPPESAAGDPAAAGDAETDEGAGARGMILLVSDELESDRPLVQALESEEFRVISSGSAGEAIELIGSQTFKAVFIRDTVSGDYIDLIDRLRKVSPGTSVRYYESTGQMLLHEAGYGATEDLMAKSMQLFTTLLTTQEKSSTNHAGIVARYADKLCRQLNLSVKDRLNIVNAAYLHDISRYYYGDSRSASDCRTRVQMTTKLLDSLNYPPLVVGMLRKMYIDLEQKYTRRLPIEALGGNILTIVDIFSENVSFDKRMSLDRFENVRSNLVSLSGRLFLPEVVEAFVEMIEQEILVEPDRKAGTFNQVLMYCEDMDYLGAIAGRLKEEGFRPVALDNADKFVAMYRRSRPDIIILLQEGLGSKARGLVKSLCGLGVEIAQVPTFLVTSRQAAAELAAAVDLGLEDVIPIENSLDLLTVKLQKLRSRIEEGNNPEPEPPAPDVTSGDLGEMSLLELLQAMGPSCKTAKIRITSDGGELTMCLDKGRIVYAEGDHKAGAEAVFEGVAWRTGKWVVHPISEGELPPPNNDRSNEDILMESCRRLDEQSRTPTRQ